MTSFNNPKALNMIIPNYRIDNIIGIKTGSFGISAPSSISGYTTATQSFTTGFGDNCLFQGIFSTDGVNWNDFGAMQPNLSTPGQPVLDTVTCFGAVSNSGVFTAYGLNYYDNVHSSGSSYTIQYKIAFFAKDNQGTITPLSTNEKLQYDSSTNYQKIYKSGSFSNGSSTTIIAHNLGYIPKVREWIIPSSNTLGAGGTITIPANSLVTPDWFTMYTATGFGTGIDSNNAYFTSISNGSAISATILYRIYWDS